MSCTIVDSNTTAIVNGLLYNARLRDACPWTARAWAVDESNAAYIAGCIAALNRKAYASRYNKDDVVPYLYTRRGAGYTLVELYKLLTSLVYQCSEADAVDDTLYAELVRMQHELAHSLVCRSDAYEAAPWSLD
jgi:hypothetical protein